MKKNKMQRMKLCNWMYAIAACFLLCAAAACGSSGNQPQDTGKQEERDTQESVGSQEDADVSQSADNQDADTFTIADLAGRPSDYAKEENWLKIPEITHEVDTFYLYPTCYVDETEDAKPICDIDNEEMQVAARQVYENQGTVYEESTNVFAPFYRQSNIYQVAGVSHEELEEFQKQEQRTDVYAALDYYFENYNDGRPFILAGHSQGSIMTKIVLGEYMQAHPEYYERMVAAYPIGYSITRDWLEDHPYLKFARGADDTGVIVSWNTEGKGNKGQKNLVVEPNAISINPINWKLDDTYAGFEENLGSRILDENTGTYEIVKGIADAQVDMERGVVICTAKNVEYAPAALFGPESLHSHDYEFYYENLRENVKARVETFLKAR